ncbi:MAG TPA: PEGA domain-containing protein [Kofleriaceae bacterium]|nr:PEGA domain-containing protein [Kofleriaceae bacterium]
MSRAVAAAVRAAGWTALGTRYSATASAAASACLRRPDLWSCISSIVRDKQIRRVAVVSVDPRPSNDGTTDTVITERLVIANSDSLFVAQRFCNLCTEDRLAGLAAEVTKELIGRAVAGSGRTTLVIKSTPRNARAYVDTSLIGATDTSISVVPGVHTVTVEHDEYASSTRHILVDEDTTQEVSFTLQPRELEGQPAVAASGSGAGGMQDVPRRSRLVPGALTAAGLGMVATGAVLLAIDQDPVTTRGVDVPARYRDTGTRGVIVGACGLAVAGAGVYLWWRDASSDRESRSKWRSRSAPVAVPVNGGVALGLVHSF